MKVSTVTCAIVGLMLTGCQTSDPTQGGYFGWSSKRAGERQRVLKENLDRIQDEDKEFAQGKGLNRDQRFGAKRTRGPLHLD
tara:strand:+ start:534 stop:779 length:246 start_codon:yes stop_codon:yes gene_type:complete